MTHFDSNNDKLFVSDITQNAIITHPVAPSALLIAFKGFAVSLRVLTALDVFPEPPKHHFRMFRL